MPGCEHVEVQTLANALNKVDKVVHYYKDFSNDHKVIGVDTQSGNTFTMTRLEALEHLTFLAWLHYYIKGGDIP